jgi:hypothetical protein
MGDKDFMDFIKNPKSGWYAKWTDNSFYPTNKIQDKCLL